MTMGAAAVASARSRCSRPTCCCRDMARCGGARSAKPSRRHYDERSPMSDPLRQSLHGIWSATALAWGSHADYVDDREATVTQAMLEALGLRPEARVLELACGPGGAGLAAAELVGPCGEVVLSDIAPEMTAIAAQRADARNLANVRTAQIDIENIDFPDASFRRGALP